MSGDDFEFPVLPPADQREGHDPPDPPRRSWPRPALFTTRIGVLPHSTDQGALEALASTLKALVRGGDLVRDLLDPTTILVDLFGLVAADVIDPDFVIFAIKRQGYAIDAYRCGPEEFR